MAKWTIEIEVEAEADQGVGRLSDMLDEKIREYTDSVANAEDQVEYDGNIIFGQTG